MASLFTRIIQGEIPSYKIAESAHCFAFLDISPLTKGHTLVVPKKEVDELFDLDEESLSHLIIFSKKVATALKKSVDCIRVGVMVAGLEVPHAHIHLVPMQSEGDLTFAKPRHELNDDEFKELAKLIRSRIDA